MQTLFAGSAGLSLSRLVAAQDAPPEAAKMPARSLHLFNTHTKESVNVVYKRGTEYDPSGLASLKELLRDHRSGKSADMDPRLYDQLHDLAAAAKCEPHYEIISGYRSAETNDKMSAKPGSGVAKKSLHMQGRALDVRLKNCASHVLRDFALAAKQGGVGYYQRSDFVHIDTGTFRTWVG